MAERGCGAEVYNFFYHASCSSAHASLHHLLRMVWYNGDTQLATITNRPFKQYYHDFALVYGSWIVSQMVVVLMEEFGVTLHDEDSHAFDVWVAVIVKPAVIQRAPSIVTRADLGVTPHTDPAAYRTNLELVNTVLRRKSSSTAIQLMADEVQAELEGIEQPAAWKPPLPFADPWMHRFCTRLG